MKEGRDESVRDGDRWVEREREGEKERERERRKSSERLRKKKAGGDF